MGHDFRWLMWDELMPFLFLKVPIRLLLSDKLRPYHLFSPFHHVCRSWSDQRQRSIHNKILALPVAQKILLATLPPQSMPATDEAAGPCSSHVSNDDQIPINFYILAL